MIQVNRKTPKKNFVFANSSGFIHPILNKKWQEWKTILPLYSDFDIYAAIDSPVASMVKVPVFSSPETGISMLKLISIGRKPES